MISDLRPYAAYRDSGTLWLGEVPERWDSASIRRYSRVFAGATPSRAEPKYWRGGSIPWLASGDVNLRRIKAARQFITEAGFASSSTKWIRPGSLVLALAGQGRTKGMVATVEFMTTCNQSLAAVEPRPAICDYRYLAYYLESRYQDLRALVGDDLRDGLNLELVRSIPTPLPPLAEQSSIVKFLDYADGRIRRHIRAKQELLKLLEEQKQATIHRAVTRGLDPNVSLKPSGIEWLGDVPEHWDVVRAARICHFLPGKAHEQFIEPDGEFVCATARFVSTEGRTARHCSVNLCPAKIGDVLMVMSDLPRGRALARAYYVDDDGKYAVNQRVCVLRAHAINSQFLAYYANRNPQLLAHDDGSNQTHLPNAAFKTMLVLVPPPEEQAAIVTALLRLTGGIDRVVARARREIALLDEYRTRLIADLVTGKLDVRVAAARLSDEGHEVLALDEVSATDDDDDHETDDLEHVSEEAEG